MEEKLVSICCIMKLLLFYEEELINTIKFHW